MWKQEEVTIREEPMRRGVCGSWEGTLRITLSHLLPWEFDLEPRAQQRVWAVVVGRGVPERSLLGLWCPGGCFCAGTFLLLWLQLALLKPLKESSLQHLQSPRLFITGYAPPLL